MGLKSWAKKKAKQVGNVAVDAGKAAAGATKTVVETVPFVKPAEGGVKHVAKEVSGGVKHGVDEAYDEFKMGAEVGEAVKDSIVNNKTNAAKNKYEDQVKEFEKKYKKITEKKGVPIQAFHKPAEEKKRSLLGRMGTILTGSRGITQEANVRKKSLLGG